MVRLREMTAEEFAKYSAFSFEMYVAQLAKSSQQSAEEVRKKVGNPPEKPSAADLWYVAEHGDEVIGFFWIRLLADSKAFGYDIHLAEAYRGKGFGRAVMLEGRKLLKKHNVTALEICVFEENHVARNLYESLGFRAVDEGAARKHQRLQISI